jgi:hypothetical protein
VGRIEQQDKETVISFGGEIAGKKGRNIKNVPYAIYIAASVGILSQ